jgi:hypothetical protein
MARRKGFGMTCTRERKERFILEFGGKITGQTGNDAVSSVLRTYGLELFEEWVLDEMVTDLIRQARAGIKRNLQNREAYAAFARRSALSTQTLQAAAS